MLKKAITRVIKLRNKQHLHALFCFVLLSILLSTASSGAIAREKPSVISTTTFIHDIAKNIAGEELELISIMPVGADPHVYEPVPQDVRKIADADLVLNNGLYLEVWLDRLIRNSGTKARLVTVSEGVEVIYSEGYEAAPDPHAWMTATNGVIYARNIRDAFIQLLPEKREVFNENFRKYRELLLETDAWIREQISAIPEENRILITTHDAFAYYGREYEIEVDAVMGVSTDADTQIRDVRRIYDRVKSHNVPAIFVESTINPALFRQMASDLSIKIGGELFADSLGDEEEESGTYVGMLRYNTRIIHNALTGESAGSRLAPLSYGFLLLILAFFTGTFLYVARSIKTANKGERLPEKYKMVVHGLNVSFDRKTILSNIYLTIESGSIYGLVGPNGAGKTTLLKSILGLINSDSGNIKLNENSIEDYRKYVAYIPQKEEVDWSFPATVEDVVLMGRYPHKKVFESFNSTDHHFLDEALQKMDIEELRHRQIGELSGGQQQRVFIARAICQQADVYLMDEPFVGVDLTTEEKIIDIIREFAHSGKTVVVIHHDLSRVENYFDNLIMINQRLVASGKTADVFTSDNIKKTYSGKLTMLQQTESYIHE